MQEECDQSRRCEQAERRAKASGEREGECVDVGHGRFARAFIGRGEVELDRDDFGGICTVSRRKLDTGTK